MVVDTSIIVGILLKEPGYRELFVRAAQEQGQISVVSYVEASMVMVGRRGEEAMKELKELVLYLDLEFVPVTVEQARLAAEAFRRYGKGRHPAGLNFGDCFSYALAKSVGEPLLFKGTDFGWTDVGVA